MNSRAHMYMPSLLISESVLKQVNATPGTTRLVLSLRTRERGPLRNILQGPAQPHTRPFTPSSLPSHTCTQFRVNCEGTRGIHCRGSLGRIGSWVVGLWTAPQHPRPCLVSYESAKVGVDDFHVHFAAVLKLTVCPSHSWGQV